MMSTKSYETKWGKVVEGITVAECNRATVFATRQSNVRLLERWVNHYNRTGVKAILAKFPTGSKFQSTAFKYAVIVQDGFLTELD
jgi:hypothetical protein